MHAQHGRHGGGTQAVCAWRASANWSSTSWKKARVRVCPNLAKVEKYTTLLNKSNTSCARFKVWNALGIWRNESETG
jgi:hypothetical protein